MSVPLRGTLTIALLRYPSLPERSRTDTFVASAGSGATPAAKKTATKKAASPAIKKSASKVPTVTKVTGGNAIHLKGARSSGGGAIITGAGTALSDRTGYLVDNATVSGPRRTTSLATRSSRSPTPP